MKMDVIGVRFKDVGKVYYFDPEALDVPKNAAVIVETVRGVEYGLAVQPKHEAEVEETLLPLRRVIRLATPEDEQQEKDNRQREKEAFGICEEKIAAHGLGMNLVEVEMTFDLSKIIFYFTAEGRVDFRELVKDLASVFRTRIELRQIGVRDEAKALNGIGICGRTLCCATFLNDFQPVSIKMAKEQGLALNPTKISGVCGRLMCCLKYEEDTYEQLNRGMPGLGDIVRTSDGDGEVVAASVLRQTAKVAVRKKKQEDPVVSIYPVAGLTVITKNPNPETYGEDRPRRGRVYTDEGSGRTNP